MLKKYDEILLENYVTPTKMKKHDDYKERPPLGDRCKFEERGKINYE